MPDLIITSIENSVLTISLNRPDKHNALSLELIESLRAAVDAAHDNSDARVVILAGEGKSFCAGMDLHGVVADPDVMSNMLHTLAQTSVRIRQLPMPTIAKVQGAAIGGGCGLMVVTDFAIAHPEVKVGYPEVDLGLCPAVVAPWLIRKIGPGRARAMLLAGGTISGEEGHWCGLIDRLVDRADLDASVQDFAKHLTLGGCEAMATTKTWLNELDGSVDSVLAKRAAALSARVIAGQEAQAAIRNKLGI